MTIPPITILYGGTSNERDVSLVSGANVAQALRENYAIELIDIQSPHLPKSLDPKKTLVFPVLHGAFGEDGAPQALLEQGGFTYVGSDSKSSRLCINKITTIEHLRSTGIPTAKNHHFTTDALPNPATILDALGDQLVLKPVDQGSSRSLHFINGEAQLQQALHAPPPGLWMLEQRIFGREITIGLLNGKGLGCVEIAPLSGIYDYTSKYTSGQTLYHYPASIDKSLEATIRTMAELAFKICGCRDFARADFMLSQDGVPYLLELNTIPGLTPTSLLPKSASCFGCSFTQLIQAMIAPGLKRFHAAEQALFSPQPVAVNVC